MSSRNPTLDLLRSIAIVVVVNCHIASTFGSDDVSRFFGLGGKGVDLFFALSGWLLGHQLFSELARSGTVDVKRFWLRRWLRTLPAYYAVLGFTYAWQILLKSNWDLDYTYLWFGQTYFSEMPYFSITWSLCVEEHFYLMVAPLVLLLARSKWTCGLLLVVLAIPCVCRLCGWYTDLSQTHVRFDQCGIGVLLAYVCVFAPRVWSAACRLAPIAAIAAGGCVVLNLVWRLYPGWQMTDFGITAWALIAGALVLLANSSDFWRTKFRVPLTRYIADRSYSLYLLHVEAIVIVKLIPGLGFVPALLLTWALSLVLAECLYRLVERPVLACRDKWRSSQSVATHTTPAQAEPTLQAEGATLAT